MSNAGDVKLRSIIGREAGWGGGQAMLEARRQARVYEICRARVDEICLARVDEINQGGVD